MRSSGSIEIRHGSTPLVCMRGDHDQMTERELQVALRRTLASGSGVVVSLERVTHLGSPAIGALVAAHMRAERAGLLLALVVPPGSHCARRALVATGLLGSLTVFECVRDAERGCEHWGAPVQPAAALA